MASTQVEWRKKLRETDPEKYKALRAKDRKLCAASRRAAWRKWFAENPTERGYARTKAWREKNPDAYLAQSRHDDAVRRERKRNAGGKLTKRIWTAIKAKQNQCCIDCGMQTKLTVGHILPVSRGGSNFPRNVIAQCAPCNTKQGGKFHPLFMTARCVGELPSQGG